MTEMEPDILKAMEFAERKHLGQSRDDGQDFYTAHCLVVYEIVKSRRGDAATLCAALLHDTLEDTDTSYGELEAAFGKEVADLVNMVTHTDDNVFPLLKFENGAYSELVHKAMVIKHADTFVNVSEMYTWNPEQRRRYLEKKMCWSTGHDNWGRMLALIHDEEALITPERAALAMNIMNDHFDWVEAQIDFEDWLQEKLDNETTIDAINEWYKSINPCASCHIPMQIVYNPEICQWTGCTWNKLHHILNKAREKQNDSPDQGSKEQA